LPGVGRERNDLREFRSRLRLSEAHLFIAPWLVPIMRPVELDPGGDWLC
jgi:hypothetical protein